MGRQESPQLIERKTQVDTDAQETSRASKYLPHIIISFTFYAPALNSVAASGPTIWTSMYGLKPVLCNGLLVAPSGWAQTVDMFTQHFT